MDDMDKIFSWVSIHASVKDATVTFIKFGYFFAVSIHASVKDATNIPVYFDRLSGFQSTHL